MFGFVLTERPSVPVQVYSFLNTSNFLLLRKHTSSIFIFLVAVISSFMMFILNSKLKMPCTSSVPFCILAATMTTSQSTTTISAWTGSTVTIATTPSPILAVANHSSVHNSIIELGLIHSTLHCLIVHAWVIGYCSCLIGIPSTNLQNTVYTLSHALANNMLCMQGTG